MSNVSNPVATEWPPKKARPAPDNRTVKSNMNAEWPPRRTLAKPTTSGSGNKKLSVADVENAGFKAHDYNEGGFHIFQSELLCKTMVLKLLHSSNDST